MGKVKSIKELSELAVRKAEEKAAAAKSAAAPAQSGGNKPMSSGAVDSLNSLMKNTGSRIRNDQNLRTRLEAAQPKTYKDFATAQELYDYRVKNTAENDKGNAASRAIQADIDAINQRRKELEREQWYHTADEMERINAQYSPEDAVYSPEQIALAREYESLPGYANQLQSLYTQRIGEEDRIRRDKVIAGFEAVRNNPDYAQMSQTGRNVADSSFDEYFAANKNRFYGNHSASDIYKKLSDDFERELQNPAQWAADHAHELLAIDETQQFGQDASFRMKGLANPLYLYMSDDQIDTYSYYVATEGRERADQYFKSIEQDLREQRKNRQYETYEEWAADHPVAAFFARAVNQPATIMAVPETIRQMAANSELFGDGIDRPLDTSVGAFDASRRSSAMTGGIMSTVDNEIGKFFLNVGFSLTDNAVAAGVGVMLGPEAAAMLLSAESAASSMFDAGQSGMSASDATKLGVISGGWEFMTERMAFDELFDLFMKAPGKMTAAKLGSIFKQAGVEASEEYVNSVFSTMTERAMLGGNSSYDRYVNQMQAEGMTYDEAVDAANLQFYWLQPLESFASGFVSGGIMGTGGTILSDIVHSGNDNAAQSNMTESESEAVNTIAQISQRNEAGTGSIADAIAAKVLTGQSPTNAEIRQLRDAPVSVQRSFEQMTGVTTVGVDSSHLRANVAVAVKNPAITVDRLTQYADGAQYDNLAYNVPDASAVTTIDAARQGGAPLAVVNADDVGDAADMAEDFRQMQRERRAENQNDSLYENTPDTDAEGRMLSETQKSYFKNSVVRDSDGKLLRMYHGSPKSFTVFDHRKSYFGMFGRGMYFTTNAGLAREFTNGKESGRVYQTYLNVTNPCDINATADMNKWRSVFDAAGADITILDDVKDGATNGDVFKAIHNSFGSSQNAPRKIPAQDWIDAMKSVGWDGIIDRKSNGSVMAVTFDSNQIKKVKNTEPTENADIRFSTKRNGKDFRNTSNSKESRAINDTQNVAQRDAAYLRAVFTDDNVEARKMVRDAAKAAMPDTKIVDSNGNPLMVYHGTNTGEFTVFDSKHIGQSSGDTGYFGKGFYFARSFSEAKSYGEKRVIPAYLNITNPFNFAEELDDTELDFGRARSAVRLMNFAKKFPKIAAKSTISVTRSGSENSERISLTEFAREMDKTYRHTGSVDAALTETYEKADLPRLYKVILANNDEFTNELKARGYDGVVQSDTDEEIVAFYPEQIKSAELETYNDSGETIPLSERFNSKNADIRFSARKNSSLDSVEDTGYNQNKNEGVEANGRRKERTETPRQFAERARQRGLQEIQELPDGVSVAYRNPRGSLSKKGKEAESELARYGVSAIFFDSDAGIFVHKGNKTVEIYDGSLNIKTPSSTSIAIGISDDTIVDEHVGHELFHMWVQSGATQRYASVVRENLLLGESFDELFSHIATEYFDGAYDAYSEGDSALFNEELVAYISGMIHSGQDVTGLLENPDEVIDAWNTLVKEHVVDDDSDNPLFRLTANQYNAPALEYALEENTLSEAQLASLTSQLRERGIDLSNNPDTQELLEAVDMLDNVEPGFVLRLSDKPAKAQTKKTAPAKETAKAAQQKKPAPQKSKPAPKAPRTSDPVSAAAARNITSTKNIKGGGTVKLVNVDGIINSLKDEVKAEFTNRADVIDEFARAFGHKVRYFTGGMTGMSGTVYGFYYNGSVYANVDNLRSAGLRTVAHEICHDIAAKDSTFVSSFYRLYREYCESNGLMNEFNRRYNDVYNNGIYPQKQLAITEEVLADMFGELAESDSEFFNYCVGKRPSLMHRIIEAFDRILRKLHLKKFDKAAAGAMELRNYLLGVMAEYKANQTGVEAKLSSAVKADYRTAQSKAANLQGKYIVRGDSGVNLTEWDTTGLASPAEYKNLKKAAPNEITDYGFKRVIVDKDLRSVLIVNPSHYISKGYHADMVASSRSLAAALGVRLGFIAGATSRMEGKGGKQREVSVESDFLLTDDNTLYINLDSEVPYTKIVAGAWWSLFRKSNPVAASNLERLAERTNKLTGNDRITQDYAVGMLTRTGGQGIKALALDPETLIKKLSDNKSAAYAFAHERPGIIRKLFENAGDMVAKLTGKQDYRAAYISGQLQARLMKLFSETTPNGPGGNKIETVKRKTGPEGVRFMSVKKDADGQTYIEVEGVNNLDERNVAQILAAIIKDKFNNLITVHGQSIRINQATNREWRESGSARKLRNANPVAYRDKLVSLNNADELIAAVKEYVGEEKTHSRNPKIAEFARGPVRFKVGPRAYLADVLIATTVFDRSALLYDLVNIEEIKITDPPLTSSGKAIADREEESVDTTIPHPADEVKFSARRDNNAALREPTRTERRKWLDDYADTYGQIPEGENVNSRGDQRIPRRIDNETKTRQTYRTYAEALTTPDDFVGDIEKEIIDGRASYTPLSNKAAAGYAERKLAEGMDEAMATWNAVTHGDTIADKNQIALGERLIMEAINNRDVKLFTKLVSEVAAEATRAGQMVQAISMVKRLSPEGQLMSFQKEVAKLNEELANRKGHPQITPSETLTREYMDIASELEDLRKRISELEGQYPDGNRTERQQDTLDSLEAREKKLEQELKDKKNEMITDAAEQMPPTWMDKLRAWRYLAMLGNPRTHIRNLLGNAVFIPAVRLKQGIAGAIESVTVKPGERTQGVRASKALRNFAREDAKTQLDILAAGGKYNQTDNITAQQKSFNDNTVIGKVLNKLADINSAALEGEDAFFLRKHYEFALSRFAAANRWSVDYLKSNPEALAKARGFAYREAQRATYRDMSSFAQLMSKTSNKMRKARGFGKLGYMMFEGALPFKKTPCNIMKRGIEYSPLGVASALSKGAIMLRDRRNGVESDYSGTEFINDLAAGMTGTMIMGLGYLMASLGMLHGRDKDEEDEINAIQGVQEYSVIVGGHSYTVDWVTPVAFPLFVGAELYDQISADRDGYSMDDLYDSLAGIAEPLFSLSMMDGIQSMMQSYSSEGAVFEAGMSAAESYLGQFFPTLSGQLARTVTPEVHTAYYRDKTDALPDFASGVLQQGMAKIPGLYDDLPEKIDVWGRNVGAGKEWYQRAAENFLSPGYLNRIETTDADRLVQELYRETGDTAVIPSAAAKYFSMSGERYDMAPDEYVKYAKTKGKTSYGILVEFSGSDEFRSLTPEQQVSCVETAYKFANAIAKSQTNSGYAIDVKWQREAYDAFLAGETTLAQAIIDYKTK